MTVIETQGLTVRYPGAEVLTDVSFRVAGGEYVAIVGPNGSGKTTLVRALLGLTAPAAGGVRLFDCPRESFRDWQRIGYLPQLSNHLHQAFPATVREVVLSGRLAGKPFPKRLNAADRARGEEVLDLLQIADLGDRLIGRLSGGQQQRVLLARAMVAQPDLLVLDEPTVALDPGTRSRFYETLHRLNQAQGTTIVLVTHDTGTIGQYASKMLYIDKRLIFFGSFEDFCHSAEMAAYFGEHTQHVICHRH